MTDSTTERHAELREELAQAIRGSRGHSTVWPQDERTADAVLSFIERAKAEAYERGKHDRNDELIEEVRGFYPDRMAFAAARQQERVRVVGGLAATIKALPTYDELGEAVGGEDADEGLGLLLDRAAVLAVVGAAGLEGADETHAGWEGRCAAGHVHRYKAAREDTP